MIRIFGAGKPMTGYPTFRNFVCLGRAGASVRRRAKKAGLKVVNAKQFRLVVRGGFSALVYQGTWYDTVKY